MYCNMMVGYAHCNTRVHTCAHVYRYSWMVGNTGMAIPKPTQAKAKIQMPNAMHANTNTNTNTNEWNGKKSSGENKTKAQKRTRKLAAKERAKMRVPISVK